MRDIKRIYIITSKLRLLWDMFPDWRFYQLMTNLLEYLPNQDPFYIEDDELSAAISKFIREHAERESRS